MDLPIYVVTEVTLVHLHDNICQNREGMSVAVVFSGVDKIIKKGFWTKEQELGDSHHRE